jgi:hypothetical protein
MLRRRASQPSRPSVIPAMMKRILEALRYASFWKLIRRMIAGMKRILSILSLFGSVHTEVFSSF